MLQKLLFSCRRGPSGKFIPPIIENRDDSDDGFVAFFLFGLEESDFDLFTVTFV